MNIFDLAAVLTLNKKDYDAGLEEAEKEATGFGDKLKKGLGTATKVAGAVTGAAVAAGAGIMKMASSSASAMDVVDKASQRMQVSTESYQELAHVAGLSGVEMGSLERAAKSLDGSMSFDQAMNEIYSLQTAEERAAKAAELFGDKVAYDLTPMLNASGAEFEAMKQEAHDLGLVMSEDDVKAGAALNDSLSNLKDSFGAIITRLGNSLMPLVKKLADGLIKFMPKIQAMFDKVMPLILDFAGQILPFIMDLAETLLPTIFQLLETVMPTITMIAQSVLPIITSALSMINPLLQALNKILEPILKVVNLILEPLLKLVNFVFGGIADGVSGIASALGEDGILGVVGKVGEAFDTIFGGIAELLSGPLQAVKDFFNGVWDVCTKIMGWVWDKVSGVFQDIYDFLDWINPFSDSAEERAEKARAEAAKKTSQDIINNGGASGWIEKSNNLMESAGLPFTFPVKQKTEVGGTITLKGVNDQEQFVAASEYTVDQLAKDARMGYGG